MKHTTLILGDLIALILVTIVGFASHGEFAVSFVGRMGASLVPLAIGWFLLAPSLGLFDDAMAGTGSQLWRPAFVMMFAGPLAALLRGIVLNTPVIPSFAIVLTLTAGLALTVWRGLWVLLSRRSSR